MLRRRRVALLLPVVVAGIAALVCSLAQPDRYAASAEVLIRQPADLVQFDPQTGIRRDQSREVSLQADLITSAAVKERVTELIGSAPSVSTTVRPRADVVVVSAEASTTADARTVVDAYVRAYVELRRGEMARRLLLVLERTTIQYQAVTDQLAAHTAAGGPLDAEGRVLLLQQAELQQRIDQAQITVGSRSSAGYALGPARGDDTPASPKPVVSTVLASFAGALVGLLAVTVLEVLDDTIAVPDDLGPLGLRCPVIAEMPRADAIGRASIDQPKGPVAEAVRRVRTALPFLGAATAPKVILVTSANPAEGKTSVATNLAAVLAATGGSSCLVSADLRRPRVEAELGIDADDGLSTLLLGSHRLPGSLVAVAERPGLYVLPSGPIPPNPAELLGSPRTAELLAELRAAFDTVVIDSAPVLPVTDAALLAEHVDLVLLVVAAGQTTRTTLERAIEVLHQVKAPVAGLVFNQPAAGPAGPVAGGRNHSTRRRTH